MRFVGWALIVLGLAWFAMCFLGIAMMSRGINWFTEAVLPSAIGILLALFGIWLINRPRPSSPDERR